MCFKKVDVFYIHNTKLSDLWCEYMRLVICLLGYDIMNVYSLL